MSFAPPTFQIYSDTTENHQAGLRKTKATEASGKPPATKRAALGVLTNHTRVQPIRAAKQGFPSEGYEITGAENVQPKTSKTFASQPFTIHVDDAPQAKISGPAPAPVHSLRPSILQNKHSLHSAVTTLQTEITDHIVIDDSPSSNLDDSPMVLDTSCRSAHRDSDDTVEKRLHQIITVPDYTDEIYEYLLQCEKRYRPKQGYMKKQPDINSNMRNILVDWLVEVAEEYKLHRETLNLAVNYIDRFLSQMSVLRGKLQLVGAACMFLAAKYEEIYPPEVGEFVYITDDTYSKKQVLKMENLVLKVLSFDVAAPTINLFCTRFLLFAGVEEEDRLYHLTMMLSEFTLIDSDTYLDFLPSIIAAASLCLANHTLHRPSWPASLVEHTGYDMDAINACVQALFHTFAQSPTHPQQAVRDKYKLAKFKEVSLIRPPTLLPPGCSPVTVQAPVVVD